MTKSELIAALKEFPDDALVLVSLQNPSDPDNDATEVCSIKADGDGFAVLETVQVISAN